MSPGAQLGHPAFWTLPDEERAAAFRVLREQRPVSFQAELQADGSSDGPGFWAFTRYSDVLKAGRDPETFVSGEGWMIRDTPPELARFIGSLVAYDPPRHTELRSVMSRSFTTEGDDASGAADRARRRRGGRSDPVRRELRSRH